MNKLVIAPQDNQRIWTDLLYLLGFFHSKPHKEAQKASKIRTKKKQALV